VVFVVLGAGAAAIGNSVSGRAQTEIAGFVLVVLGLAFVGLLPVPERLVAPGLLTGARRRGSGALLGGAFAVCAAPCIGTVLAARRLELERAGGDDLARALALREHGGDVDAAMGRPERPEPPRRLLELPCGRNGTAAAGLVPRDGDVHEPLVEVALRCVRRPP